MSQPLKQQEQLRWKEGDKYDPQLEITLQIPGDGRRQELTLHWWRDQKPRPVFLSIAPVPPGEWETTADLSLDDMRVLRDFFTMMLTLNDPDA